MLVCGDHEMAAHWSIFGEESLNPPVNFANFGSYNIYAKRASFKDDGVLQQFVTEMAGQPIIAPPVHEEVVPIAVDDDNRTEMTEEEKAKRKEFERKRKEVATPEGLDIKAVLGRRISIPSNEEEDEDDGDTSHKCETEEASDSNQKSKSTKLHSKEFTNPLKCEKEQP
nr:hypothetical transcript [Hymenolepis microstoma]